LREASLPRTLVGMHRQHESSGTRRPWFVRGVAVTALSIALANGTACGRPERGQLMLSFSTDMDVNADVGAVGLSISIVGGGSLSKGIYPVKLNPDTKKYTPELPSTLAVVSNGENVVSVRVQLVAYKDEISKKVLGLREVVSQVPLKNFRTTRVPVTWLSGVRFNQSPGSLGPSSSTPPAGLSTLSSTGLKLTDSIELVEPLVQTGCSELEVFTASGCKLIADDELSKGAEGAPNQATACLDVNACYNNSVTGWAKSLVFEVDNGSAKKCFALIPNPTANLNLGIATEREVGMTNPAAPSVGFGVLAASATRKVVPLGRNQPFEGWTTTKLRVDDDTFASARNQSLAGEILARYRGEEVVFPELAPAVCDAILTSNDVQYLYATSACAGVSETLQPCTNGNPAKAVQAVDVARAAVISNDAKSAGLFAQIPNGPQDAGAMDAGPGDGGLGDGGTGPLSAIPVGGGPLVDSVVAALGTDVFIVSRTPDDKVTIARLGLQGSLDLVAELPGLAMSDAPLRVASFLENSPNQGELIVWAEGTSNAERVAWDGSRLEVLTLPLSATSRVSAVLKVQSDLYAYGSADDSGCIVEKVGSPGPCSNAGQRVAAVAELQNGGVVASIQSSDPPGQYLRVYRDYALALPPALELMVDQEVKWLAVDDTYIYFYDTKFKRARQNNLNEIVEVPLSTENPGALLLHGDFIYGGFGGKQLGRFSTTAFANPSNAAPNTAFLTYPPMLAPGSLTSLARAQGSRGAPGDLVWTEVDNMSTSFTLFLAPLN
jgi:hypothetical protein